MNDREDLILDDFFGELLKVKLYLEELEKKN